MKTVSQMAETAKAPRPSLKNSIKLTELKKFDPRNKTDDEKSAEIAVKERKKVTPEQIQQYWNTFIKEAIAKEPNSSIERLLKGRKLHINGTELLIEFENTIQIHKLNDFKEDLMFYIRTKAENGSITLTTKLTEQEEKEVAYTSHQKFKVLVEKYPILDKLKERFGLDIEF